MTQDVNGNGYISGEEINTDQTNIARKVIADQKQSLAERKQAFAERRFDKEFELKKKQANKPNINKR